MMLRYLGSTKNLAGCVGGLIGVVLYLTGVVGWFWPFVVVALYLAGALLAPGEKVRLVPDTSAELRSSLETLVSSVTASRLPPSSVDAVRRIAEVLADLLSHPDRLAADPDLHHAVVRLAGTDLPLSVQTYLNLPWWFAARRASAGRNWWHSSVCWRPRRTGWPSGATRPSSTGRPITPGICGTGTPDQGFPLPCNAFPALPV